MSEQHPYAGRASAPGTGAPAYPAPPLYAPPANAYPLPLGSERPGPAVAAAALAFVLAGLLIVTAFFLLLFVSTQDAWHQLFGVSGRHLAAEITVDGILDLAVAGVLIGTGVLTLNRSGPARRWLVVAFGATIALSGYWLLRDSDHLYALPWAVFYGAIAAVGASLAAARPVTAWLHGDRAQ